MSDDKDIGKLDLDLIQRVQRARMLHDQHAQPSQVPAVYWIEAKNPHAQALPSPRSGEFRIQSDLKRVDGDWARIKTATEAGELGHKSKVSTVATDGIPHSEQRVICVRTTDADDRADRDRVQKHLQKLGFTVDEYYRDKPKLT